MSREVKHYMVDEYQLWPFANEFERSNVPYVSVPSHFIMPEGYIGVHISNLLEGLLEKTEGDLEKAQNGAIIFEETDKTFITESDLPDLSKPEDDPDEIRKNKIRSLKSMIHFSLGNLMRGAIIPVTYDGEEYLFDTSNLVCLFTGNFIDNLIGIPYNLLDNCLHASCVDEVIEYIETLNSKQLGSN